MFVREFHASKDIVVEIFFNCFGYVIRVRNAQINLMPVIKYKKLGFFSFKLHHQLKKINTRSSCFSLRSYMVRHWI